MRDDFHSLRIVGSAIWQSPAQADGWIARLGKAPLALRALRWGQGMLIDAGRPLEVDELMTVLGAPGSWARFTGVNAGVSSVLDECSREPGPSPIALVVEAVSVNEIDLEAALGELELVAHGESVEDWPEPSPLPVGLPPVPAFDPAWLPAAFRDCVNDAAERMQCPVDLVAIGFLVCAGSLIGSRVGLAPKSQDDWIVFGNLWGAVIAPPASFKTPALAVSVDLLRGLEATERTKHEQAVAEWEQSRQAGDLVAEARKTEARKAAAGARKTGGDALMAVKSILAENVESSEEPVRRRFIVSDATVEALGELMQENPHGLLTFRDELTGWLRAMEREGHEQDRAFHLESADGGKPFTYDRIGRGRVEIASATQGVLGGIQPGPFREYMSASVRGGVGNDGLMQRFQLMVWPDPRHDFRYVDRRPDQQAMDCARGAMERLAALPEVIPGAESMRGKQVLRFDAEAQATWDAWYPALMRRLRSADLPEALAGHLGKAARTCAALSMVLHLADGWVGLVNDDTLGRAITIMEYLEAHARRVYHDALRPDLVAAQALAERIRDGDVSSPFRERDIYRQGWSNLDKAAVAGGCAVLADLDWLREEVTPPGPNGGRPATSWVVSARIPRKRNRQNRQNLGKGGSGGSVGTAPG